MAGSNHFTAQQFIEAIPGSGGIITTIAKRVGCTWHTAKHYIVTYKTIKQAYDDERERITDMAESVVIKNIQDGDSADSKWWLTRKGKDRGFTERLEIDIVGLLGKDLSELSDEDLEKIDSQLE